MTKKPTLADRMALAKQQSADEQPTLKNTFRSAAPDELVQMNARVTPELKERVRIYCAINNLTHQEFYDEALNYFLDHHPTK